MLILQMKVMMKDRQTNMVMVRCCQCHMFGLDIPCFAGGDQNMLTDEGETTVSKGDKPVDKGVDVNVICLVLIFYTCWLPVGPGRLCRHNF